MLQFFTTMENEAGEMCSLYLFSFHGILLCGNNTIWVKLTFHSYRTIYKLAGLLF